MRARRFVYYTMVYTEAAEKAVAQVTGLPRLVEHYRMHHPPCCWAARDAAEHGLTDHPLGDGEHADAIGGDS